MKIKQKLYASEVMPRGYRAAYVDYSRMETAYYPIGIHLIARLIRRIWEWSFRYRPSKLEKLLLEVRKKAHNQTFNACAEAEKERMAKMTRELGALRQWHQRTSVSEATEMANALRAGCDPQFKALIYGIPPERTELCGS